MKSYESLMERGVRNVYSAFGQSSYECNHKFIFNFATITTIFSQIESCVNTKQVFKDKIPKKNNIQTAMDQNFMFVVELSSAHYTSIGYSKT